MTLPNGDGDGVVRLRMEAAQRAIADARLLMESGSIRGAVNRAYYAMFYAASALAVSNNSGTFSKHAGLIAYIHREYVHTGKLEKQHGRSFQKAFENRAETDYQDILRLSVQDVEAMIAEAVAFVDAIKRLLQ